MKLERMQNRWNVGIPRVGTWKPGNRKVSSVGVELASCQFALQIGVGQVEDSRDGHSSKGILVMSLDNS